MYYADYNHNHNVYAKSHTLITGHGHHVKLTRRRRQRLFQVDPAGVFVHAEQLLRQLIVRVQRVLNLRVSPGIRVGRNHRYDRALFPVLSHRSFILGPFKDRWVVVFVQKFHLEGADADEGTYTTVFGDHGDADVAVALAVETASCGDHTGLGVDLETLRVVRVILDLVCDAPVHAGVLVDRVDLPHEKKKMRKKSENCSQRVILGAL